MANSGLTQRDKSTAPAFEESDSLCKFNLDKNNFAFNEYLNHFF